MSDIDKRLQASINFDAINGDDFERSVVRSQIIEAIQELQVQKGRITELEAENAKLRKAMNEAYDILCRIKTSPHTQIGIREVYIPHIDVDRIDRAIQSIKQAVEGMKDER